MMPSAQQIKARLEQVWRQPGVAFPGHKAGWMLRQDAHACNIGFWGTSFCWFLVRVRGACYKRYPIGPYGRMPAPFSHRRYQLYIEAVKAAHGQNNQNTPR